MLNLLKRITVALCLLAMCIPHAVADNYVKREVRSVWMTTVWQLDWPTTAGVGTTAQKKQKEEMISYLDLLKSDNFNTVYFQVRSMSDAMYRSSYEPWSSYLTGSRGKDPGWDPLAFVVEECHKRGMECHAWVNPYRWSTGSEWNTPQDIALQEDGLLLSHGTTTILNPGLEAARKRIVDVCREITKNYDIDGIVFDDYFYPNGITSNSSAGDYQLWQQTGAGMTIGDWRRSNVNRMVADVYNMIQAEKPYVKFGISPAGAACTSASVAAKHGVEPCPVASDWQYNGIFSDPVEWLEKGTIDYISPQLYWKTTHSTNPFGPMTKWWSYVANKFGRHHYASHSISLLADANNQSEWQDVGKQLQYSRDYTGNAAPGQVYYSAAYITGRKKSGLGEWLLSNKYQRPALAPAIDWKPATRFSKPNNLKKAGNALAWDAVSGVRYSVYAIPSDLKYNQIQSDVTGGIASDYLLDVTYTNSFTIPEDKANGHYYAVCILDRYGNEFEPRYTNESTTPSAKTTLLSPVKGAGVKLSAEFKWSAVQNAAYELDIASDADFQNLLIAEYGLTQPSMTVDVTDFERNKTYYWRVVTSQPECYETASETATFTTLAYDPAERATLSAPANGSNIDNLSTVDFSWNAADGCICTLQVAADPAMTKTVFEKETEKTSLSVPIMSVGFSKTLYWRVATNRHGYTTSHSDVWSFTTPTVPTAETTEIYAPADGETVKNNFFVEFKRVDADRYTMQVSETADFTEIARSVSPGWEIDGNVVRGAIPVSFIPEGSYFWRIAVSKAGCEDSYSEVRALTVENKVEEGGTEKDYTPVQDKSVYDPADDMQISSLWFRSVRPEYGNIVFPSNGSFNRSFCVLDNVIYVSGREENASDAACYLDKYDALTGAKIGRLDLSGDVKGSYFPCNDVMKDGTAIAVSNMTLNIATTPLRLYEIDKTTGEATLRAECVSTKLASGRIDHCSVSGSISTGNFVLYAAVGSGNKVLKWTFKDFGQTDETVLDATEFYPGASDFGIAPRVFPFGAKDIFVNGGSIAPMRISAATGGTTDSFKSNPEITPAGLASNGFSTFKFANTDYMVYPAGDHSTENGFNFVIAKVGSDKSFSSLQPLWTVPQAGFGSVFSTTNDALIDYEIIRSGRVELMMNVYLYVPGNGIAAYSIFKRPVSGIADITGEDGLTVEYANGSVRSGRVADRIEIYNLSGTLVAAEGNTGELAFSAQRGIYIVRAVSGNTVSVKKITVK